MVRTVLERHEAENFNRAGLQRRATYGILKEEERLVFRQNLLIEMAVKARRLQASSEALAAAMQSLPRPKRSWAVRLLQRSKLGKRILAAPSTCGKFLKRRRQSGKQDNSSSRYRSRAIDLDGILILNTEITLAHLNNVSLRGVQIQGAKLMLCGFVDVDAARSRFEGSRFIGAHFAEAALEETRWQGSQLLFCKFKKTNLRSANFSPLKAAWMSKSDGTDTPADLHSTELTDTDFRVSCRETRMADVKCNSTQPPRKWWRADFSQPYSVDQQPNVQVMEHFLDRQPLPIDLADSAQLEAFLSQCHESTHEFLRGKSQALQAAPARPHQS